MPSYRTIAQAVSTEIEPIKKSRFIADASPIQSQAQAHDFIASVRKRHPDAGHHCYAWRLQAGDAGWRVSDDGEPGGTAGMPILARIDGHDLCCLVVVVARWFGGTKLGKGGLIRAYGGAAAAALAAAEIIEVRQTIAVTISIDYPDHGVVEGIMRSMEITQVHAEYGSGITIQAHVPVEELDLLGGRLRDATSGRATVAESDR